MRFIDPIASLRQRVLTSKMIFKNDDFKSRAVAREKLWLIK